MKDQLPSKDLAIQGVWNLILVWRHKETTTNEGSRIINITEKVVHQHVQNATFGLFPAARLFTETCRLLIQWIDILAIRHHSNSCNKPSILRHPSPYRPGFCDTEQKAALLLDSFLILRRLIKEDNVCPLSVDGRRL